MEYISQRRIYANGNETGITNPNTTTVTKGYDHANRLTSVTNKNSSGTVLSSYTITPNADSQVTGISESGGSAVTYGYDALGHLTSDVRTGTNAYSKSYTVDGEGNRTGMTVGGTSSTFNYNNDDWLTSTTGGLATSYGYDNAGEQTSRTVGGVTYTLAYDYEGQLVSITHSSTTVSFTYDATGRRMSRTSAGTTNFYYDGGQVQLEAQGGTVTSVYSYGNALTRKDGEFSMFDGYRPERTVTNSSKTATRACPWSAQSAMMPLWDGRGDRLCRNAYDITK